MLYRLIYNRFVASQMAPAVYETLSAEITDKRVGLRFYGEHKVFAGFTTLYEEGTDESEDNVEMTLPALKEGQKINIKQVNTDQHFTQPRVVLPKPALSVRWRKTVSDVLPPMRRPLQPSSLAVMFPEKRNVFSRQSSVSW